MEQNEPREDVIGAETTPPPFKERIKDPILLAAASGLAYHGYQYAANRYGYPDLDFGMFQTLVDVLTYSFIGVGVYHLKK